MPQYNSIQEIGGREEGGDGCNSDGRGHHPASPDGLEPLPPLLPYPLGSLGAALLSPKKGPLPGPHLIVPFLGSAVPVIRNPTRFWERQAALAKSSGIGFSTDYLVGRFILFVCSTELSHKIFANVRPEAFHLIGHPFNKKLFGEHNLIYMFDQQHKDLRCRIVPNFTPRALSTYLAIQQSVIRFHLIRWLDLSSPSKSLRLRLLCRDS